MAVIIKGYSGLGDNLYQIPVVREVAKKTDEVYLETPFPQFYSLIQNVKFLKPNIPWRTQNKMMQDVPESTWTTKLPASFFKQTAFVPTPGFPINHQAWHLRATTLRPGMEIRLHYGPENLARKNILGCFEEQAKVTLSDKLQFFPPSFLNGSGLKINNGKKPIAIIRPPTDRKEWFTPSRQCDPTYTNIASQMLIDAGYHVVSVADVVEGKEWIVGDVPNAHEYFHKGELGIMQLMSLVESAHVIVGGVGWIVPAGIAYERNLFIIFGGRGGYDNIGNITDMRLKHLDRIRWASPENFCRCTNSTHHCDKRISDFETKFATYLSKIKTPLPKYATIQC